MCVRYMQGQCTGGLECNLRVAMLNRRNLRNQRAGVKRRRPKLSQISDGSSVTCVKLAYRTRAGVWSCDRLLQRQGLRHNVIAGKLPRSSTGDVGFKSDSY